MKTPIEKDEYFILVEAAAACRKLIIKTPDNARFTHAEMILKALCEEFVEGSPKERKVSKRKHETQEEAMERLERLSLEVAAKRKDNN